MDEPRLVAALKGLVGHRLAKDLTESLVRVRHDCATRTLERATPGKFVETFVQCLQYMDTGRWDDTPAVDAYLGRTVENTDLPDGLRICASRVARAVYTLRNKRNVVHKNDVDTNHHDLAFSHQAAAWITAELLRHATGLPMDEAGGLIQLLQTPVGSLVEEIDGTRLVHAEVPVRTEILILLHSYYPDKVSIESVLASLQRRNARTVRNRLNDLHQHKLTHGDAESGYRLTTTGFTLAVAQMEQLAA